MKNGNKKGAIAFMAKNSVAVNISLLILLLGGFLQLKKTKQEIFPEFTLDLVTVTVVYPGASPKEVESGITLALEEAVRGIDGVKKVSTISQEGIAIASVEVLFGTNPEKVENDIRMAVDQIKTFPKDAEKPLVKRINPKNEVISLVVYGDKTESELRNLAESIREDLLQSNKITLVELVGIKKKQVNIEIPYSTLANHGLLLGQIAQKIAQTSVEIPAGQLKTQNQDLSLRTAERLDYAKDYEDVVIKSSKNGEELKLKDIASLEDGFEDVDKSSIFNGKPAVMVKIFRSGEQKPLEIAKEVKSYEKTLSKNLPKDVSVAIWNDYAELLEQRIDLLISNAIMGLILVFIVLGLFLELRLAFWVTMGIPISFLGTFLFLPMFGVSINMISLFAFIIVLGMVVDDAIVVGENIYSHRLHNEPFLMSSIRGVKEIAVPVVFAVLTTMAAFMPLFFVPGVMGKFFYVVPVIIVTVLAISLFESIFMLPNHLAHTKPASEDSGVLGFIHEKQQVFSDKFLNFVDKRYRPLVEFSVRNRYLSLLAAISLLIITISFILGGRLSFSFMPKMDSDIVLLHAEYPIGTPILQTKELQNQIVLSSQRALEKLGGKDKSKGIYSQIGSSLDPSGAMIGKMDDSGGHICDVMISLVSSDKRKFTSDEFTALWQKELGQIPSLKKLIFKSTTGPDAGKPISLSLKHKDIDVLEEKAKEVSSLLKTYNGVISIEDGIVQGKDQFVFKIKDQAKNLGISTFELGSQIRNAFYGAEAIRRQRDRDEIKVVVSLPKSERQSIYDLENFKILTNEGEIPLKELAYIQKSASYSQILREDGARVITVSADTKPFANANQIMDDIEKTFIPKLIKETPNLIVKRSGEQKEQTEVMENLKLGFLMALLLIYALIAIPLKSYIKPLIIMSAIPFGIVGATFGHILMGFGLSVISIMGIVALSGIVVNDSLVFVHAANEYLKPGCDPVKSIADVGVKRFRPILLTSLTTFFGLIPMVLETSMQARFLIPMAVSIAFGVLFSTFVTLIFVPALYVIVLDLKALKIFNKNNVYTGEIN